LRGAKTRGGKKGNGWTFSRAKTSCALCNRTIPRRISHVVMIGRRESELHPEREEVAYSYPIYVGRKLGATRAASRRRGKENKSMKRFQGCLARRGERAKRTLRSRIMGRRREKRTIKPRPGQEKQAKKGRRDPKRLVYASSEKRGRFLFLSIRSEKGKSRQRKGEQGD